MSDGVTVAEIVEHAYRCGAVKVTNYRDPDGEIVETWAMRGDNAVIASTEQQAGGCARDRVAADFENGARVFVSVSGGGIVEVFSRPDRTTTDGGANWYCADWREAIAAAGVQP